MKLDAYSHILPRRYFARMRELAVDTAALKRWLELDALHDLDARLRMMDEFGDGYQQVLTLSSPPIERLAAPHESPALARLANESLHELCARHPDRFPAFVASLPLNNPDAALAELAHALDDLGARGVQLFTNVDGKPLDAPSSAESSPRWPGGTCPSGCTPRAVPPSPTTPPRTPRGTRSGGRSAGRTRRVQPWPGSSSPACSNNTRPSRSSPIIWAP
ncbi:amidohydrolase family protein [Streptomyces alboflavus]|uniref:amidohydrolase family protein n=1 Tax=Streptomyces alboflavus TaxID=67267 RepID=UPI001F1D1E3A|nr:amidohydrolase family protein [Streptomyces alboflavus]